MARPGDTAGASSWSRLLIALLLSGIFLYLALRGEDWQRVGQTLLKADYRWVLPMAGMGVFSLFVRTQRWRLLLNISSGRQLPLAPLFSASAVGFMSNMLLPFRVGEVIRPWLVSRNTGVPMSMAVATVVLERVLDLIALLGFALLLLVQLDLPPE
ncbi:MAG: flippase-like domain-containing protein, partial [Proteobacteria bacterium]|nr:flippase-like domain-containing protein [Pseudomonadota bacterium]